MKDNKKLPGWTCSLLNLVDFDSDFYRAVLISLLLSFKDSFPTHTVWKEYEIPEIHLKILEYKDVIVSRYTANTDVYYLPPPPVS